jgi:hypothetical protein
MPIACAIRTCVSLASWPEFLQRHFLGYQCRGAGLDLLAARGTYAFHFLIQSLHG